MMDEFKVLMIDDDEVIAQTTAEYFNMFDVKTAYVTNYDDAVAFLEKNMVSLLLLDINLGDKSGFDLCPLLQSSTNKNFSSTFRINASCYVSYKQTQLNRRFLL